MHCQSESHYNKMRLVGEDPKKYINDYSNQFQHDFIQLLRTSHSEKQVQINHFYQEYIANKEHIHMNSTKWSSLTQFAQFLGREGICRVEETDKGIHVAWIDNSPEALRRQDAIRKKERQDRGDEEREQRLIKEQIERAKLDAEGRGMDGAEENEGKLRRSEGDKIKLSFGLAFKAESSPFQAGLDSNGTESDEQVAVNMPTKASVGEGENPAQSPNNDRATSVEPLAGEHTSAAAKVSLKMGLQSKPKNVFAAAKKNALGGKKIAVIEQPKKMSEAERIMKEEMERKRGRGASSFGAPAQKKQRV